MNIGRLTEKFDSMDKAIKYIEQAWIAGIINAAIVAAIGMADFMGYTTYTSDVTIFVEAGIILGLSYGVKRRSRVAAFCLLLYSVASNLVVWPSLLTYGISYEYLFHALILFALFYFVGLRATIVYHTLYKTKINRRLQLIRCAVVVFAFLQYGGGGVDSQQIL